MKAYPETYELSLAVLEDLSDFIFPGFVKGRDKVIAMNTHSVDDLSVEIIYSIDDAIMRRMISPEWVHNAIAQFNPELDEKFHATFKREYVELTGQPIQN